MKKFFRKIKNFFRGLFSSPKLVAWNHSSINVIHREGNLFIGLIQTGEKRKGKIITFVIMGFVVQQTKDLEQKLNFKYIADGNFRDMKGITRKMQSTSTITLGDYKYNAVLLASGTELSVQEIKFL